MRPKRDPLDFYPTPPEATIALLRNEVFPGTIWEPACGNGAISKILIQHNLNPYSSDLADRNYGHPNIDFLNLTNHPVYDNIITNPPYSKALEFVLQAKKHSRNKVAMLLRTLFLESESRYSLFQDQAFPLKTVYQFSKRLNLTPSGIKPTNASMVSYAWFVWDRSHKGKPYIEWIK